LNPVPSSRWQSITTSLHNIGGAPADRQRDGQFARIYRGGPFDAHLTPLNIAATMGLPALAAFIAIFVALWRGRSRPTDLAIWSGLADWPSIAMAQDIEDFRHVWVMIGLAASQPAIRSEGAIPSKQSPKTIHE
jgi:hypothetical protein